MEDKLIFGFAALLAAVLAQPVTPAEAPVSLFPENAVTQEELNLVAQFEDRPLYKQQKPYSTVHYPGNHWLAEGCDKRGCTNGCTVGFGYNLGARWKWEIMEEMTPVVGEDRAQKFSKMANLAGTRALNMCRSGENHPTLTRDESFALLRIILQKSKDAVLSRLEKDGIELNSGQLTVLVALEYQNPVFVSKSKRMWPHLAEGDHKTVAWRIKHRMGTIYDKNLQNRRNNEYKKYLESSPTVVLASN